MNIEDEIKDRVRNRHDIFGEGSDQLLYITINKRFGISKMYRSYGVLGDGCEHFGWEAIVWEHLPNGERTYIAMLDEYENIYEVADRIIKDGEYKPEADND